MTSTYAPTATRSIGGPAIGTAAVTAAAVLWANFVDSPWKTQAKDWGIDTERGLASLVLTVGFVALGVGVIYGVVVRRSLAAEPSHAARTALILAIVGVPLGIVAFWSGLPIVLGSAAAYLGVDSRARLGRLPSTAGIAIGLGLLVAGFAVFFCVTG